MLITFTGRKSHKEFTTPVRYIIVDGTVRCFTASANQWWRNLSNGADVELLIAGSKAKYRTNVRYKDPETVRSALVHYLKIFPQDAAYHDIRLNRDKSLNSDDLERASVEAVVVEALPIQA